MRVARSAGLSEQCETCAASWRRGYARSRLLIELGRQAGLLGEADDQVDRLYPHRLRHTFVTMLLDREVPLPAVQDAARHASADTTRLYDRSRVAFREHPTHKLVFD